MTIVAEQTSGGVRLLRIGAPETPVAAERMLRDLDDAIDGALADPDCRAVVLDCAASGPMAPDPAPLRTMTDRIEAAEKPVIAALSGACRGDMFELALAAHYRIVTPDLSVALPGLQFGLPPRAGASQRLPRLCGSMATFAILLDGADHPAPVGFADLTDNDPVAAALDLAAESPPAHPTGARTDGLADPAAFMAGVADARERLDAAPLPGGARRSVECVEAAMLLPFESGLEMERSAFDECAATNEARALSWLERARAEAWDVPEAAGGTVRPIARIAVVGATRVAADLVLACLDAGIETFLVELDPAGRAAVLDRVLGTCDARVAEGAISDQARDATLARLTPEATFEDLAHVDAVWEAAVDSAALKTELWRAIGLLAPPGALLATAGATVGAMPLGVAAGRAGQVVGLHVAGPSRKVALIELALPPDVTADAVATALALARRLDVQIVRCADHAGYIAHRLQTALERKIEALMIAGADAETIDEALMAWGYRASPCFAMDVEGLDRVLARRRAVSGQGAPTDGGLSLLDALVEAGLSGRDEGAGLFAWTDGQPTGDDAQSRSVMDALADGKGITRRTFDDDSIQRACLAALADEGARMIADATVLRAGDVDVAAVGAIGFPRLRGGPMRAADQAGLIAVERDLALSGDNVTPSPLFSDLIKQGRGFTDMRP
ncbi:3-hydroxyacyl-CoA dehydrogenase NAD-binding domain-containing protein [Oceaniglobus indicus]|uniref:3-hydroxyacyl-CoA dehydrogenase NAD-binding domain-containing protein n=1 Tax=Oceaniglobus indicus TaxID=2047749 RepID=UPI000C17EC0D|nr:3-hydroxyacyl-CoA dehydrogenase NAD-binding domain-containing protein [Oceaniglobus indicus]